MNIRQMKKDVDFVLSGNATFQIITGKSDGARYSNANEQSSLFINEEIASTSSTAF